MRAEISCGVYFLPSISSVLHVVPMCRLTERMVRSTLVTAWFLADWPTRTSPFLAKATTDGVVREPSEFAMTVGSPPSRTVTTELVVPRSIPTARAMGWTSLIWGTGSCWSRELSDPAHLAWGPLNFPAHPNGSLPTRVPGVVDVSAVVRLSRRRPPVEPPSPGRSRRAAAGAAVHAGSRGCTAAPGAEPLIGRRSRRVSRLGGDSGYP